MISNTVIILRMLDTDGYVVLPCWFPHDGISERIAEIKTEPIFNDRAELKTDRKRRQATLSSSLSWVRELRGRLMEEFPALRPSSVIVVESLPGCQRQAAHCDYIPTPELLALPLSEMPLLMLIAIEPNTTIDVWPGSHRILRTEGLRSTVSRRMTVHLDVGDAIVFRADLVHAGSAYETANRRLHVYLDNPEYHRDPNRTWIIYKHAPKSVASRIEE